MSRGPEGDFWKEVRAAWPGHAIRIEASDGEVEPGTPDTILSIDHRGGFIELKVWPDDVSAVQLAWHADALDRGAYAMVLSKCKRGVWLGRAEDYHAMVLLGVVRSRELVSLHKALNVVASALRRSLE